MEFDKEGIAQSGSAAIHYYECGEGPPLVLLHGNGEDRFCFNAQISEFSKHFHCIVIESRSHGNSSRGAEPLSLSLFAGDAVAVLDSLGISRAYILGFSDGGNVALYIARKAQERILSLILSGANFDPSGIVPKDLIMLKRRGRVLKIKSIFSDSAKRRHEIWMLMLREPHFTEDDLSSITCPALITAGEKDMILAEHTHRLHSFLKNSKLHIFSGGDHFVHLKQAKLYNNIVLNYLKSQEDKDYGKKTI